MPGKPRSPRRLFAAREPVATAKIAYAEVYAALTRRRREGDLAREGYTDACAQFERDWAVHLASALSIRDSLGEEPTFVAADERLLTAARAERLRALNPETV